MITPLIYCTKIRKLLGNVKLKINCQNITKTQDMELRKIFHDILKMIYFIYLTIFKCNCFKMFRLNYENCKHNYENTKRFFNWSSPTNCVIVVETRLKVKRSALFLLSWKSPALCSTIWDVMVFLKKYALFHILPFYSRSLLTFLLPYSSLCWLFFVV